MKVIWDDLGRSIKLIVCAMGNYYLASIWTVSYTHLTLPTKA